MKKVKESPVCVHCGRIVTEKVDGGTVRIPTSITNNQFPEYYGKVMIHNKCLNKCIAEIVSKRKPMKAII